jgi:RNA polymerase sigma-70 factor (ECF subfamily)
MELQTHANDSAADVIERLKYGGADAAAEVFEAHRARLSRMLAVRLDPRVAARVSADDVLQEAFLDVSARAAGYAAAPAVPVYVWLRFLTLQRMQMIQRAHLGAKIRAAGLEVALPGAGTFASAESMAGMLAGDATSPSRAAMRRELRDRLHAALAEMDPLDREVLALRHFEELGNNEVAAALGIGKDAASKRHVRALKRLRDILSADTTSHF